MNNIPQGLILLLIAMTLLAVAFYMSSRSKSLNNIKSKEVGDGQHGKDHFATEEEVKEYYKTVIIPKEIVNMEGKLPQGRIVNFNEKTREAYIDTSDSHFQVEAPTESGKTSKYVIPNIQYNLMAGTTMIIPDTKKELFNHTAADAKRLGYDVYLIDFSDPLHSHTFDYFEDLNFHTKQYKETGDIFSKAKLESHAGKLAKMIVGARERSESENTFFTGASEGVIHSISILLSMFANKAQINFSSINSLIGEMMRIPKNPKENKPVIFKLLDKLPQDFGAVKYFGPAYAATGETESNIYSSVFGDINPFIDSLAEQIIACPVDDRNKFSSKKLIEKKSVLYLSIPEDEEQYYIFGSTIIKSLYNQLSNSARNYPDNKLPKRIYVLWEELGLYPKVDHLKSMLAIARGKGILFDLIYQDSNQLEDIYGETVKKILSSQCASSIYLAIGPEDVDTSERISKSLGTKTVKTGSVSVSQERGKVILFSSGTSHSKTEQMMERSLMTPAEVMKINQWGITLLLKRDKNPFKCHLTGYYKDEWGLNKQVEEIDLGISRLPEKIQTISLQELLKAIDEYVDQEIGTKNSFIKITKVLAADRESKDELEIVSKKLFDITRDLVPIQLLKQKNYVALFKYMDQYANKINRFELQQLIEPLAEN